MELSISRIAVLDGRPNKNGNRILATFDVTYAGMKIEGCMLVEKASGEVIAYGLHGKSHRNWHIRASFEDEALAAAVVERADAGYRALTGKSAMEA